MYYIEKTFDISASHHLELTYPSKCEHIHGHNWRITVYCKASELDENGMVVDFSRISHIVKDRFDHQDLNAMMDVNPTAENIARWICDHVPHCYQVRVQESEGNVAIYEK